MGGSKAEQKIVVTGGAGFLGSHVVDRLAQTARIVVIDNMVTGGRHNLGTTDNSVQVIEGDVRDFGLLLDVFRDASQVVHLAALTSVAESMLDPVTYNGINVEGTRRVLQAARRRGVARVVLASSAAIYGNAPSLPKWEDMAPTPSSPYGETKVAAEGLFREYNSRAMSTTILRFFNLYGPRQPHNSQYAGVVPSFAKRMVRNEPPIIHGTGQQTRDFLYVGDAADAVALALEFGSGGAAYNIASGTGTSILEVARILGEALGSDLKPEHAGPRPGDILHSWADISLAKKELGFKPRVSLREGLPPTLEYLMQGKSPRPK